jgi:uncharacterized membrane protein YraQ (UPF0718 family)
MDTATLMLIVVAAALLVIAFWRGRDLPLAGLVAGGRTLWRNLPILLLGFAIAGLAQVLIPKELITRWLGAESGIRGILVGCVAGGLVPGAPYATFPLVASLYQAGASLGAVVGFVSAWSLWSVSSLRRHLRRATHRWPVGRSGRPDGVRYARTIWVNDSTE